MIEITSVVDHNIMKLNKKSYAVCVKKESLAPTIHNRNKLDVLHYINVKVAFAESKLAKQSTENIEK